ncbi:hypothetical protein F4803DRAFT_533518 [Xylaria telfairii]|nr:hypothetical protein F4803DRAFT_533518 [Xylaria telfairii]
MAHYMNIFIHYLQVLICNYNLVMARLLNTLRSPRPLRSANRREITYFVPTAEEDGRPESSPFESASTEVYFGSGHKFTIPSSLLLNYSKLRQGAAFPPRSICLDDVTSPVGHVIFYYLLTDTYQCLRPKGHSPSERLVNELATGVGAYNASRKYDLLALQDRAKDEIQRLAQQLPFPLVLNHLRDLHLDPSASETWLDDYVQSGLKNLLQTPTAFLDYTSLQVEQDAISFSNIILKNLANLLSNDAAPPRTDDAEPPIVSPELVVIEQEPAPEPAPEPEAISEAEPFPERVEPAPSERGQEVSTALVPVLEPEPEPEPVAKSEPVVEPMAEPEIPEPSTAPEHTIAYEAPVPKRWSDFMSTSNEPVLWPEPEAIAVEEPAPEVPAAEMQYSPPRAEYLEVGKEPEAPREEPPREELSLTPSTSVSKEKKKKKLSIFRSEDDAPEPKLECAPMPAPAPAPEPEPVKPAEEVLSLASSSVLKAKKKKKRSIFRTEVEAAP